MTALLFPELQFSDANGTPLASGKIYTYLAGTTTPTPTYTSNTGTTPLANPVILNAEGRPNSGNGMWIDPDVTYKFVIKTSADVTVQTIDNYSGLASGGDGPTILAVNPGSGFDQSRTLTASTSITITDGGAGSTLELRRAALTGDVTAGANSNSTTIASNIVNFAKMQDIATDTLIGRDTAGTGDPESITLGSSLSMNGSQVLDVAAQGVGVAKMTLAATDRLIGRDTTGAGVAEELTVGGGVEFSGSGGIQRSALTGDVTASAGSNATTIADNAVTTAKIIDDAVTLAKMANIATASVIGRSSSGTGDPQTLTMGGGLEIPTTSSVVQSFMPITVETGTSKTIVEADRGKIFLFTTQTTSTVSVTVPSPASLPNGWYVTLINFCHQNLSVADSSPGSSDFYTVESLMASSPTTTTSAGNVPIGCSATFISNGTSYLSTFALVNSNSYLPVLRGELIWFGNVYNMANNDNDVTGAGNKLTAFDSGAHATPKIATIQAVGLLNGSTKRFVWTTGTNAPVIRHNFTGTYQRIMCPGDADFTMVKNQVYELTYNKGTGVGSLGVEGWFLMG